METVIGVIVLLLLLLFIISAFLLFIFSAIVEPVFIMATGRPAYVHLYPFPKRLEPGLYAVLERDFRFYRNLTPRRKKYFRHRVASFMTNYKFAGREGLHITEDIKLKVAATAVMLSFGMRNYLHDGFTTVLLYPDTFLSANGVDYHKGEFNPMAGVVVFSWKHFEEGMQYDNDNLNLGLHEFAHVMHFDAVRKGRSTTGAIYVDMFKQMMAYATNPANRDRLVASGYLRDYAYTNQFEFMAVVLEHFFETPTEFKQRFPELYAIVKRMINFREG
ncbi:MAG: zinc-dependent peptidase [Flavobacterium sp.]